MCHETQIKFTSSLIRLKGHEGSELLNTSILGIPLFLIGIGVFIILVLGIRISKPPQDPQISSFDPHPPPGKTIF